MGNPLMIDGVCDSYNFSRENLQAGFGEQFKEALCSNFPGINPPNMGFSRELGESAREKLLGARLRTEHIPLALDMD